MALTHHRLALASYQTALPGRIIIARLVHLVVVRVVLVVLTAGPDAPERHASNEGDDHGNETREGKHLSIRYRMA